jgi:hypothetical protein
MSAFLIPDPCALGDCHVPDLFPRVEPPARKMLLAKAMRPENFARYFEAMTEDMEKSEGSWIRFDAEIKYDGHSVTIALTSDGRYFVQNRTERGQGVLEIHAGASRYFTAQALELQVKFMAEECALYEGREAGFLEVPAVKKIYAEKRQREVPKAQLVYRIFGVVSISPAGLERTGDLSLTQTRHLLDRFIIKGGGMFEVAERIVFRAWKLDSTIRFVRGQWKMDSLLRFERQLAPGKWRTVAMSAEEYRRYMLAEADALGCEGFVLKKPRAPLVDSLVKANTDSNGILRDPSMVKLKREFGIHAVACVVVDGAPDQIKKRMLWLYGRKTHRSVYTDGPDACHRLDFAGDVTDHAVIGPFLKTMECAFFFSTKQEETALRELNPLLLQTEPGRFQQVRVTCTNFSKTHFNTIGVKNDAKREALDFDLLTDMEEMARSHPHFRSTKLASDRLAVVLQRHTKVPKPSKKRPVSPPPPRLRAAYLAPSMQDVAVGPDAEIVGPVDVPLEVNTPYESVGPAGLPYTSLFMSRMMSGLHPRTGLPHGINPYTGLPFP